MAAPNGRPASSGTGVAVQGLKLPFTVTFASSFDAGYEPSQLEQGAATAAAAAKAAGGNDDKQTTHIKGWQSAKYCPYPQSVVLQFPGYFDIRKIQILSHQAKIANTYGATRQHIEIYAGVSPSLSSTDDRDVSYTRLGYLSLDSNERSGFKARELKSVYVNARGNFLRLTIKKCHVNAINQFNQVGIIAINVVGTKVAGTETSAAQIAPQARPAVGAGDVGSGSITSLMSQYHCDEKTALKILELERQKSRAIALEDYDEAKKVKVHLDSLKEVGSRLAQLEQEKAAAVAREDYDLAKQLKREIEYLRGNPGPPPQQHQQQRRNQQEYANDYDAHTIQRSSSQRSVGRRPPPQEEYEQPPPQQQQPAYESHSARSHHPPAAQAHYAQPDAYDDAGVDPQSAYQEQPEEQTPFGNPVEEVGGDDRPIRPSRKAAVMTEDDGTNPRPNQAASQYDTVEGEEDTGASSALSAPDSLSAAHRKDAEPLIDVFGEHTVLCLYSRAWGLRHQAIREITQSVLENANDVPAKELFGAACRVLKRGLADKVSQVLLSAGQLLQVLLQTLATRLRPEEVKSLLEPIVAAAMEKLASPNIRERDGGMQVLVFLAFDAHVHPSLVPASLLAPLKKKDKDSPLPLKTRAKLLLKCVIFYGLDDAFSLSLASLTRFVLPHLVHRDAGVREGMCNLVAGMSSIVGIGPLQPHFKDLRPQTLESLQQKLDDVADGAMVFLKPTQPRLDQPYVSEADPTHTTQGGGAAGGPAGAAQAGAQAQVQAARPRQAAPAAGTSPQPKPAPASKAGAAAPPIEPAHQQPSIAEEESTDLQGKCQFCGLEDPLFTEEKLDLHYWQECPLLISCKQCEQVIEIPTLHEHLLHECEVAAAYQECPTCFEAVGTDAFAHHTAAHDCRPPPHGAARCALCHADVEQTDEGWKQHLLVDTCPKNTRVVKR